MRPVTHTIRWLVGVTIAACLVSCGGGDARPKMNDYRGFEQDQSLWPFEHQMLAVLPVPSFTVPVRILRVDLRTVNSAGQFDSPDAFILVYQRGLSYAGPRLTYQLQPSDTAGSTQQPLNKREVSHVGNDLNLVVPINIHVRGCHEAQIVLEVQAQDGRRYTMPTRWFVGVDTGVSNKSGFNACAGPLPKPSTSATAPA